MSKRTGVPTRRQQTPTHCVSKVKAKTTSWSKCWVKAHPRTCPRLYNQPCKTRKIGKNPRDEANQDGRTLVDNRALDELWTELKQIEPRTPQ